MLRFVQFIKEMINEVDWSYGHPPGSPVKINNPSHAEHGKTGRVIRQLGHEHGVDTGGGKLSWHRSDQLTPVKEQEVPAGKMGTYHEDFNDDVPLNPRTTKPENPKGTGVMPGHEPTKNTWPTDLPAKKVVNPKGTGSSFKQRADAALTAGKNRRGLAIPEMKLVPNPKNPNKPLLRPDDHDDKKPLKYFVHPHLNPDPKHNVDEKVVSIGPGMFVRTGKGPSRSKAIPYWLKKDLEPKKPEQITPVIPSTALKSEDISTNVQRQIDPNEGRHSSRNAGKVRLTPHNPNQQRDGWPS